MKELTTKQFMTIGLFVFLIIAIANLAYLVIIFDRLHITQKVSQLAGVFFNFLLAYMFYSWSKQQPAENSYTESKDINEVLEKFKQNTLTTKKRENKREK